MKLATIVSMAAAILATSATTTPPRPVFPQTQSYEKTFTHLNRTSGETIKGQGYVQRDLKTGQFSNKMVTEGAQHHVELDYHTVAHFFDEKTIWRVEWDPDQPKCYISTTRGVRQPDPFDWIRVAEFQGTLNGHDLWVYQDGMTYKTVAVLSDVPNIPVHMSEQSLSGFLDIKITNFSPTVNQTRFAIPPECAKPK